MLIETAACIKDFFSVVPLFAGLGESDLLLLAKSAQMQSYKKGEYLHHQGEEANRLSIIQDGWVRLYRGNLEGEEGPARLFTRGDVLGERVILPHRLKHFFSAQVIAQTQVINIPATVARDIVRRNPGIMSALMLGLIDKMGEIHIENEHMAMLSAPQRVACLLLRLSSYMLGKGGTFTFPYDKSLAAGQLGMKRETFSRALACLQRYGVKSQGAEIKIDNFVQLSAFCCTRCSLSTECRGARCMQDNMAVAEPVKRPHTLQDVAHKGRVFVPPPYRHGMQAGDSSRLIK